MYASLIAWLLLRPASQLHGRQGTTLDLKSFGFIQLYSTYVPRIDAPSPMRASLGMPVASSSSLLALRARPIRMSSRSRRKPQSRRERSGGRSRLRNVELLRAYRGVDYMCHIEETCYVLTQKVDLGATDWSHDGDVGVVVIQQCNSLSRVDRGVECMGEVLVISWRRERRFRCTAHRAGSHGLIRPSSPRHQSGHASHNSQPNNA